MFIFFLQLSSRQLDFVYCVHNIYHSLYPPQDGTEHLQLETDPVRTGQIPRGAAANPPSRDGHLPEHLLPQIPRPLQPLPDQTRQATANEEHGRVVHFVVRRAEHVPSQEGSNQTSIQIAGPAH